MNLNLDFCSAASDEEQFIEWFYDQLHQGNFLLAFQPITSTNTSSILYNEGLLRHSSGRIPLNPFPILERRRCIRTLDRYVVGRIIKLLHQNPDIRLGCNISAQSAVLDEKWHDILAHLRADRTIAERLVIEITESSVCLSHSTAVDFVHTMRSLGCLVAVDDFGSGFSTLEFIRAACPDIIKIDKGYLQRARKNIDSHKTFRYLVHLCKTLAPYVVVEGVEIESDKLIASDADWAQGFLIGKPCLQISRTWNDLL